MNEIKILLANQGFAEYHIDGGSDSLLKFAMQFGSIIVHPNGEIIDHLQINKESAHALSFTKMYGSSSFPFHSDGAQFEKPPRYLVIKVTGDFRRKTRLIGWNEVLGVDGESVDKVLQRGIWKIRKGHRTELTKCIKIFSTSCRFFDPQLMIPENRAATDILTKIDESSKTNKNGISWSESKVAIIDNWKVLHGRGDPPREETQRILHRVYVGE